MMTVNKWEVYWSTRDLLSVNCGFCRLFYHLKDNSRKITMSTKRSEIYHSVTPPTNDRSQDQIGQIETGKLFSFIKLVTTFNHIPHMHLNLSK